jgi:hypothetical protein
VVKFFLLLWQIKRQRGRHGIKSATASPLASAKLACGWPKDSCGAGVGDAVAVFIVMAQAKAHPPTAAPSSRAWPHF